MLVIQYEAEAEFLPVRPGASKTSRRMKHNDRDKLKPILIKVYIS